MKIRLIIKSMLVTSLLVAGFSAMYSSSASALSANQFQAGRIIDDSVFFNKNSMSMQSVQQFLEAKVPSCDTNGTQQHSSGQSRAAYGASKGYGPPYTCLRDFRQDVPTKSADGYCNGIIGGNKSAAQIIVEVANSCGINPQSLIVTLQKEQALITDDWPWSIQYRSAMGYGCPDTAPCDSEYYGFFNQVYNAARQFKRYALQPTSFNFRPGRTSYIQYNPNAGCGGTNVFLQNQATAGLYNYTPYQPNSSALNNLYGEGDGCGAYGNRNFWRMFNDWFGPTIGPLVRTPTSGELYYSDGAQKYRVGSMNMVMEYGLGLNDVRIISQQEFDALPLASSPNTPDLSYVVKSNSDSDDDGGNIYLVTNGLRYHIPSMDVINAWGFDVSKISYMPLGQITRMPVAGTLSNYARATTLGYVFKLENGTKRAILDLDTLNQQNPPSVQDVSPYVLDNVPTGDLLMSGNAVLRDSGGGMWLVAGGKWHYVPSMTAYTCLGMPSMKNLSFTTYQTHVGTQGEDADCTVQTSGGQKYLMDGWRRIPIDNNWGFSNFFDVDDSVITRLGAYSPTPHPLFRTEGNGALYTFEGGKKRQIISMSSFYANGYTANDIFTASTNFLSTIPGGYYKLGDGMVVSEPSTGKLFVINGSNKTNITSMETFYAYGFDDRSILPLDAGSLSAYPTSGNLARLAKAPGSTLYDSGIAVQIPSNIESAYGINGSTPAYPSGLNTGVKLYVTATRYLKFHSSGMLYYLENGTKRPVYSWDTFTSLGGNLDNIMYLTDSSSALFPTGAPM